MTSFARAPQWLLDMVVDGSSGHRATADVVQLLPGQSTATAGESTILESAALVVRSAQEGARNVTLNCQAFLIGKRIAAGLIPESEAWSGLFQAALDAGLSEGEITRTLRSGLRAGMEQPAFRRGSDVEIAHRSCNDVRHQWGNVVYCEGEFWRYDGVHWERILEEELRQFVHYYDGAPVGAEGAVKLSSGKVSGIINEMRHVLCRRRFFNDAPSGINCAGGFIRFSEDGQPSLEPHSPDHRQRHVLPGRWAEGQNLNRQGSMLDRLMAGCFQGDEDAAAKIDLLAEVAGSAALGYATRLRDPKAVVLHGPSAENGKSQILDLMRGQLPPDAVSSISPGRFGNRTFTVNLAGKLLNATDELGGSDAIASDQFKQIITGEPLTARDLYRPTVEFRPVAQHVFATNTLPTFRGGFDMGVRRRLLVVTFNRTIPRHERVERIGQRVAEEEPDLLLDWAVQGAARLIRNRRFTEPESSREALREWILADPVAAWLESDNITTGGGDAVYARTRDAYRNFEGWATSEGYRRQSLPQIKNFSQRIAALGPQYGVVRRRRGNTGAILVGLTLEQGFLG